MSNKKSNCVAFIFARGGSKGVPGKNIKMLGGMPLIAHSIKMAQSCPFIDQVIVSTDDHSISTVAKKYGAEVPFIRPAELADDHSSEYDAWKHGINEYKNIYQKEIDIFISLPATSPLRNREDIKNCYDEYLESDADMVITVKEASRSPYFNMVKIDNNGWAGLVNLAPDGKRYIRRQDVPAVYDMTTVAYVSGPDYILNSDSIFDGRIKSVLVPEERALDIDTMFDFKVAECLINSN